MSRLLILLLLAAAVHAFAAGPVDFGTAELNRAIEERGLPPGRVRFRTEMTMDPPGSYRILPGLITGGDLRGLMYGLLEAAGQVRRAGRLVAARGEPATEIRGIRYFLHNQDLEDEWYYSHAYWLEYFRMLARNRFNRFNLVFAHQTDYLAPPYPFWFAIDEFPEVRATGLSSEQQRRNLEMLRFISQTAADHGIDFTLGIWEHNIQPNMKPSVEGLTRHNVGPYSYAALKRVLSECPAIRSVQMRTNSESGIPADYQVEFYRDWVFRALREAGRRVTLDLRGWLMHSDMRQAALRSGVPLRLSTKYWAEHIGRPYQPAETWPGYSFLNFLEKPSEKPAHGGPRPYHFYWEVWGLGSHRLLLWGDPDFVRRAVPTFRLSGSDGFEIDPPLAQKGFGNRPGKWSVFAGGQNDRVFWKHEFERYWMFYTLWGRLSYDPKTPDRIWTDEIKRRFGAAAAPAVMDAYKHSSRVLSEIVAAHMPDPNMYVWPEINPGGLIDAYREIRPSDWRFIASIREAVRNRIEGVASAKQTPGQTAARLDETAKHIDAALAAVKAKAAPAGNAEWRSSEPDFQVLALLARYHARKQMAAAQMTYFDETGDVESLQEARREVQAAAEVWGSLVELTDGLYPAEMAFGPSDIGHWKDKLPYVLHDVKLLEERAAVFERFGRFHQGFDFGVPKRAVPLQAYRADEAVLNNHVAPRFQAVSPETSYSEETGFGWAGELAEAAAEGAGPAPYAVMRAIAADPKQLPENVLFGDFIRGRGPRTFRARTGPGGFVVSILKPDASIEQREQTAVNGHVDVVFPEGEWTVSGVVLRSKDPPERVEAAKPATPAARPAISHFAPKSAAAGRALTLSLKVAPVSAAANVRLHYRTLNQLAKFKTLEAPAGKAVFTIPAEDLSPQWDLMYYFEVLNKQKSGWFHPDPDRETPYVVVEVQEAKK